MLKSVGGGGGCFARLQAAWEEESIVSSREFHHSILHRHVIPLIKLGILELLKKKRIYCIKSQSRPCALLL